MAEAAKTIMVRVLEARTRLPPVGTEYRLGTEVAKQYIKAELVELVKEVKATTKKG